jgi:hypothetical protein
MALEAGHQPGLQFTDQSSNTFMNGSAFAESAGIASADGAIETLLPNKQGVVHITKGSAAALTINAPVAGDDDGKCIYLVTETAFAHVLTSATNGFNDKGSSGTVTWTAAKGNGVWIYARNGRWWASPASGVTIA